MRDVRYEEQICSVISLFAILVFISLGRHKISFSKLNFKCGFQKRQFYCILTVLKQISK